jgi:hypothetical protein
MDKNIFKPTFGNRPPHLVGRETIIAEFEEALKSSVGHPGRSSILIGQRGFGKTAMLLEFADHAEKMGYIPVIVTANARMLDNIIQIIQTKGSKYFDGKGKVTGISAGVIGFSFGLNFTEETEKQFGFRIKLTLLLEKLAKHKKGVLLLVDEIQAASPDIRELATTYQHLVGEDKNIAIVMAGLPSALSAVLNDEILTFLNRAKKINLDAIPEAKIKEYYRDVFSELGRTISEKALETATKATKGFPYMLQLIGFNILDLARGKGTIGDDTIRTAIRASKAELSDSVHKPCLNPLSEKDLDFLKAMVPDRQGSAISDIQERMNVSQGYAQTYRKRLIDSGIIASARRGKLEFIVPYLREYLKENL